MFLTLEHLSASLIVLLVLRLLFFFFFYRSDNCLSNSHIIDAIFLAGTKTMGTEIPLPSTEVSLPCSKMNAQLNAHRVKEMKEGKKDEVIVLYKAVPRVH